MSTCYVVSATTTGRWLRLTSSLEGFFRRLRSPGQIPRVISNTPGGFPKRAPIGVYDPKILCDQCERQFGEWDDYAQRLLTEEPVGVAQVLPDGTLVGWELPEYRYDLLKLFFISILWRASVSSQQFYRRVNLGEHEAAAKKLIEDRKPGTSDEFAVTLARFDAPLGQTILDPHPEKCESVNYYRFYLGAYVAYIKVDRRPPPTLPFGHFALRPNEPLKINSAPVASQQ